MEMKNVLPTVLAALPAIVVSIVSIVVNCLLWRKERKNAQNAITIKALEEKLNCFYYPYLLLEKENTTLYSIFARKEKREDKEFRTLNYLLRGKKEEFSESDKSVLKEIIANDRELYDLINKQGHCIDSSELREGLSKLAVHYKVIELAYEGDIQAGTHEDYSEYVYPHDIQDMIRAETIRIENEIARLKKGD